MNDLHASPKSNMESFHAIGYVKDAGSELGRGVFATRLISKGEIVEVCPVILIKSSFEELPMELRRVVFNWHVLANMHGTHAIALGLGSMYNHGNPANLRYEACGNAQFLRLIAVSEIAYESEMTINYNAEGGFQTSASDTWFESVAVTPFQR